MTDQQAFLIGAVVAWTPCILLLAWQIWRAIFASERDALND
jgi:hypothetical protein